MTLTPLRPKRPSDHWTFENLGVNKKDFTNPFQAIFHRYQDRDDIVEALLLIFSPFFNFQFTITVIIFVYT
jgi:hypothetical protein